MGVWTIVAGLGGAVLVLLLVGLWLDAERLFEAMANALIMVLVVVVAVISWLVDAPRFARLYWREWRAGRWSPWDGV